MLKLFKVILARSFGLNCTIPQLTEVGGALIFSSLPPGNLVTWVACCVPAF